MAEKITKTDAAWRAQLSEEEFHVTRKKGTERAFTGRYHDCHIEGMYACVCCGEPLFSSADKFESGTGWPSFTRPVAEEALATLEDSSFFSTRTEVLCARCDAHLGHVFPDGPRPTGQRFCINSASLRLEKKDGD